MNDMYNTKKHEMDDGLMEKRVLHFVSSISIHGGVMSLLMNYYRHIDRRKLQFDFVYFLDDNGLSYKEEIEKYGGKVYFVAPPNKHIYKFETDMHHLYKTNRGKYVAVHLHDIFLPMFLLDIKKQLCVDKVIIHAHLTVYGYTKNKAIRNRILSLPKHFICDEFWACSKDAGRALFGRDFYKKGFVLKNAIDINKFQISSEKKFELKKELNVIGKYIIGHVGSFNEQKNHEFIIDVFYETLKKNENSVLILIGDGKYQEEIKQKCKNYKIESYVRFLGVRDDVHLIMGLFDVFIFPSKYEGLGIAFIEAQTSGVHCVVSDTIPFEANIISENNDVLSLNVSKNEWVDCLLKKKSISTTELRKRIAEAGYDINYEVKKIESKYLE